MNSNGWLSDKRLRAHGTILAVCLWSFYIWNLATPGLLDRNGNLKGTDFLHFYTLGSLAAAHDSADLYNTHAQAALATRRVPAAAGIRYLPLYPPQVSMLFAPLSLLPYGWALSVWWVCGSLIYVVCCYAMWRACPNLRDYGGTVAIVAVAFPAFFHLIAWGQTSALALVCFTLVFFLLRDKRDFLAGLVLGCLIFKPQLGVAAAVLFVSSSSWKVVAGAILSAVAQLSAGVVYYGTQPLHQWIGMLWNVRAVMPSLEPKPYQTHSLRTFWSMLLPWPDLAFGLYVISALAVLAATIVVWRRGQAPLPLRYSALVLASVLVAPHLTVYDLVILAPAILLLADWLAGQKPASATRVIGILLYLVYALPLLGPSALKTHVQLSVIAMSALAYWIWNVCIGSAPRLAENSRITGEAVSL